MIMLLASPPDDGINDVPDAVDFLIIEVTAEHGSELATSTDDAEEALLIDVAEDAGATNNTASTNTGMVLNDFQVSFGWAMNRQCFTFTLKEGSTESGVNGEII